MYLLHQFFLELDNILAQCSSVWCVYVILRIVDPGLMTSLQQANLIAYRLVKLCNFEIDTLRWLTSCTVNDVCTLVTAEESARLLLPSQEVLSECCKNDWTMAVAGTSRKRDCDGCE